jgi:phage terminase small subunit
MARKLSTKQSGFIKWMNSEECFDNRTESARRAGYKGNDVTLASIGYENIKKPQIRAAIEAGRKDLFAGANVTIENVLTELQKVGRAAYAAEQYSVAGQMAVAQGKYLKMFTERIEQVRAVEDITDAQLLAEIRFDCEELGIDPEPIIAGYFGPAAITSQPAGSEKTH